MDGLFTSKLELLENYYKDLNQYKQTYYDLLIQSADNYDYICDLALKGIKRLSYALDIGDELNWNNDVEELFDNIEDIIRINYVNEYETKELIKNEFLLEIAKNKAEKINDKQTLDKLNTINPVEISKDKSKLGNILKGESYNCLLDIYERTVSGFVAAYKP